MRLSRIAGIAVAAIAIVTPSAFAQTDPQTQTPPPQKQAATQSVDSNATQTFTGCLMKETDYRRAHNLGGGTAGGVGLGDEFVLVNVKVSPAPATAVAARSSESSVAVASASATTCADQGVAYRVTGTAEEKIKNLVGHQLAIVGRFKHAADAAVGGTRPDEKLPAEVEIISFSEAPAPAAAVSEPVTATPPPPPPTRPQATTPPPPPPASTVDTTPRPQPATPATTEPRALPRTASSTALLGLIGVLALSSGLALTALRRRAL